MHYALSAFLVIRLRISHLGPPWVVFELYSISNIKFLILSIEMHRYRKTQPILKSSNFKNNALFFFLLEFFESFLRLKSRA